MHIEQQLKENKYERFLAFFDILGFKNLIQNNDLDKVLSLMKESFLPVLKFTNKIYTENGLPLSEQLVNYLQFSDSIVFYTEGSLKEEFARLIHVAKVFIYSCLVTGIPVRGSITHGEFYKENDLFFGKALVEAYEKGEAQQWVGAFINQNCVNYAEEHFPGSIDFLLEKGYLVIGDIPVKNGVINEQYIINWANEDFLNIIRTPQSIRLFFVNMDVEKYLEKNKLSTGDKIDLSKFIESPDVESKIINTISFWLAARNIGPGKILKFKLKE